MVLTASSGISRFFPSRVQTLNKYTKLIAFSFPTNGSSAPVLNATTSGGVASIAHTSTGVYTVTFQNQFKSIVSANATLQLASGSATSTNAAYVWTDSTDTDSTQFLAGPAAPGALGNAVKVVVATGSALATAVSYGSSFTTVTLTIDTTVTTPTLLKTYVNTTAPNGLVTIGTVTGTTAYSAFLSATELTGGATSNSGAICQLGAAVLAPSGGGVIGSTLVIRTIDPQSGTAIDIAAATGNNVNCELVVTTQGDISKTR